MVKQKAVAYLMKKQWDEARAVDYVEEVWRACLNVPYDITTRRPMPKTKLPSGHVIAMLEAMVCMGVLSGYGHTSAQTSQQMGVARKIMRRDAVLFQSLADK